MQLKSTLKRKSKLCIKTLDFLDLLLPNFFCFYLFSFILFLENFFLEFWKISKVTPKHREQRRIYIYIQSQPPPTYHSPKKIFFFRVSSLLVLLNW